MQEGMAYWTCVTYYFQICFEKLLGFVTIKNLLLFYHTSYLSMNFLQVTETF